MDDDDDDDNLSTRERERESIHSLSALGVGLLLLYSYDCCQKWHYNVCVFVCATPCIIIVIIIYFFISFVCNFFLLKRNRCSCLLSSLQSLLDCCCYCKWHLSFTLFLILSHFLSFYSQFFFFIFLHFCFLHAWW